MVLRMFFLSILAFFPLHLSGESMTNVDFSEETNTSGSCDESDQQNFVYAENHMFVEAVDLCGHQSGGNANQTTQCLLKTYPELSKPCATCFGQAVGCMASKCFLQCSFSSKSERCLACFKKKCEPHLVECTGVEEPQLPKRKM